MSFYEVFINLFSHGRRIGRTSVQLRASSPFVAASEAERTVKGRYGKEVTSQTIRVNPISKDDYFYQMAA